MACVKSWLQKDTTGWDEAMYKQETAMLQISKGYSNAVTVSMHVSGMGSALGNLASLVELVEPASILLNEGKCK